MLAGAGGGFFGGGGFLDCVDFLVAGCLPLPGFNDDCPFGFTKPVDFTDGVKSGARDVDAAGNGVGNGVGNGGGGGAVVGGGGAVVGGEGCGVESEGSTGSDMASWVGLGTLGKKSATEGVVGSDGGLASPDNIGPSPSYFTPYFIKEFIALFCVWLAHSNFSMVTPGYKSPCLLSFDKLLYTLASPSAMIVV